MSIRSKIWLFAAVSVVLVLTLGGALYVGAESTQRFQDVTATLQLQNEGYRRLRTHGFAFLEELAQAREAGADTGALLAVHEGRLRETKAWLLALAEEEAPVLPEHLLVHQREVVERATGAWLAFARRAEVDMRPWRDPRDIALELRRAQVAFRREVVPYTEEGHGRERESLGAVLWAGERGARLGQRLAVGLALGGVVLVVGLALLILRPMRRTFRELSVGAERIGAGDFTSALPVEGDDEYGTLARAFNRMARTLAETQRQMREQAEASARELSEHNAALEASVEERTTELRASNAKLMDSLQKLRETQAQLVSADRLAAMGRLAAGVGHEINNPLAFILSNLDYVRREFEREERLTGEDREQVLEALTDASQGADRIRLIVKDLRTLSREEESSIGPVDVGAVVRSAAKLAAHELRHRARLVVECEGIPCVQGNAARLGQVFLNLFINAAHAMPPGSVDKNEVRVVAWRSSPERVTVEVRDTGRGIAPEHLEHIFDPFFTTKPVGMGTGLGLSVCRGIVDSLDGTLTVESAPGRGTSFRLTLPVSGERVREAARPERLESPVLHKRILVVDDEPLVCAALQRSLVGARVVCALNARQALERLQEDPPYDFILCDLMMPDTTGMAFYEEAVRRRAAEPERFIFMTGASTAEEFQDFLEHTSQPHLEKPFTQEALWVALGARREAVGREGAGVSAATPSAAPM